MSTNERTVSRDSDIVTVEKSRFSDLWKKEDWLAVWIGVILIAIAAVGVLTGAFDFSAANFSTWGNGVSPLKQLSDGGFWIKLLRTFLVLGVLFTLGVKLKGQSAKKYIPAYIGLFVLAVFVRFISAEFTLNRYLEWAFWALIVGLVVSNTVGVPKWLKPAVQTEYYIKAGLVVMGFSVLFSNIINFGLYGLGIAWIVTPIVIIFMWFFGTRMLKMDNKPLVITLATATSVCGTSAAIAVGASSKAKKTDLSLSVSISIIFTVLMMVFEPIIIKAVGLGEVMGGALIGGTVDSTGAVTVAGTALGETAQTVAVLVKSIQNILIGFFAASLIASFIFLPAVGKESVSAINKVLDQYKNWAFVLAFTSIGLDTNFKEIT